MKGLQTTVSKHLNGGLRVAFKFLVLVFSPSIGCHFSGLVWYQFLFDSS